MFVDRNSVLKQNFRSLQRVVVSSVNTANIIDFLFQERILGDEEMRELNRKRSDPQQQCRDLLALLHTSDNPVTFIKLYDAIKDEPQLPWLIDRIDACSDHSEQQQTSDQTGQFQSISQISSCNKFLIIAARAFVLKRVSK